MSKSQDKNKKKTKKATKPSGDEDVQLGEHEIEKMETEATKMFIEADVQLVDTESKPDEDVQLGDDQIEKPKINDDDRTELSERRQRQMPVEPGHRQLPKTVKVDQVQITIPVAETQMPRVGHLDITLGQKGRRGLQRLLAGCLVSGAKLESGKHVNTAAMAARWLIEQIADAK